MRALNKLPSTTVVFGAVLLALGFCGILYWKHVATQSLHLQERNFRVLTVTSRALGAMVANYATVFKSVIEGEPPCSMEGGPSCSDKVTRSQAYKDAIEALPGLKHVRVAEAMEDLDGFAVRFVTQNGTSAIKLTYVHQDRAMTKSRWKVTAVVDLSRIMRQLVTEDIFSDVLLADRMGRVLYHYQSADDPFGFEFVDVSLLLQRHNDPESKDGVTDEAETGRKDNLVSRLPLFNEAPIGGISHTVFAQATDILAEGGTAQTLILVGIVPAGKFYAEARAIPLNYLLLIAGILLILFFVHPYVKLQTNMFTERLTPISVAVLIISTVFGTALLTFGLADIATYHNVEQHLNRQLKVVSEEIRERFNDNVQLGLEQLAMFDQSCRNDEECSNRLKDSSPYHLSERLCIGVNEGGIEKGFSFFSTKSDNCSDDKHKHSLTDVVYRDVKTMFWVGSNGEMKVLRSREPDPWKYANLKERQYVGRVWEDETFTRGQQRFWVQPIYSLTSGENSAVLSMKSAAFEGQHLVRPIVAALEVKLPSVTDAGVPPGLGFAVIDQKGEVLFHSDSRRNLRENLFEETDRGERLRQAVFARATAEFDGRYWGKDRHFHIAPLFPAEILEPSIGKRSGPIVESPDVHWSLVTYWDADMLRALNFRSLYSSGALFLVYVLMVVSIGIVGWWTYSRANGSAPRWVWPQSEHLHRYRLVIGLLVVSLVAVGMWYLRPHPYPDMLLWGLLPALAAAAVVLSVTHTKADSADNNKPDPSARQMYRRTYMLVMTLVLLVFVVTPTLVIFRVAIEMEWRLLVRFAQFDLVHDRAIQAQGVRKSHRPTLFHDIHHRSEIQSEFFRKFSDQNHVYADFPFESRWREERDRDSPFDNAVRRGNEPLLRWLSQIIDQLGIGQSRTEPHTLSSLGAAVHALIPRIGQSGYETDMFLETPELWHEQPWGTQRLEDKAEGSTSPISLQSRFPPPIPQWLYSLVVLGGLAPLVAFQVKHIHLFAAAVCVLGGFLWFGLLGEALAVLGVSLLLYGAYYALPTFAAQRLLLLDFSHPSIGSKAGILGDSQPPDGDSSGSWNVFAKEMSALRNTLCLTDEPTFREKMLKQETNDDVDRVKERIIEEILEKVTQYYVQIWNKCTESQRRSLFNLARDGFLHTKNPDIESLLETGLIVADLNLRPMNESFRRFILRTGVKERLDEGIAQDKASAWFQVWRPIGVGLVLIMVFLVLTQEQYRAITLAFLGALPALLGAFSQVLTSSKKEKGAASSA
ncbi:MAG: hypothetical protein OJF51_004991 [Nitrospira sp.]|nr:MAG: hypothetical protein OJF51_004991 [Nitrospira sp.]